MSDPSPSGQPKGIAAGAKPLVFRKRRTREHVLADLSANHVERIILQRGFAAEATKHDYGVDMILFFYRPTGELNDGQVFIQLKATDRVTWVRGGRFISFALDKADLDYWLAVI